MGLKVATQAEYEELWQLWSEYAEAQEGLIPGAWVRPSLAIEEFRVACRMRGWRLPPGFVRGARR